MLRLSFATAWIAFLMLPASATPRESQDLPQPTKRDFRLELYTSAKSPLVLDNKYPLVNVRVRYVGQGEVELSSINLAGNISLARPTGWKAKRRSQLQLLMGNPTPAHLKNGGYVEAVVPLEQRFARIAQGTTTLQVRVKVQPYTGEWNILDLAMHPDHKSTLKALKPVILRGDVTVAIPTLEPTALAR